MIYPTDNLRIIGIDEVAVPEELHREFPISEQASHTVHGGRRQIHEILRRHDPRILVIVGPCSIHDPKAAMEYAGRLDALRRELADDLMIVMRVYFEKPRTTVGWKGLINDPDLNNSFHINEGLRLARKLLLQLADMGMPAATEFLDLISPQYVSDLVSWGAIGARTTESQVHRELASGLSCPVGFKNATDGGLQVAVDAVGSASSPHHFLSLTSAGNSAIFHTSGNPDCHVILRGGNGITNFDRKSISESAALLRSKDISTPLMVDCSHANCEKEPRRQIDVCRDVGGQLEDGSTDIFGVMLESHLIEGRQDIKPGCDLVYGQSVTDPCLGWDDTAMVLRELAASSRKRRGKLPEGYGVD
jgi:3-deoxy-7-phosphoheptulonate synthase